MKRNLSSVFDLQIQWYENFDVQCFDLNNLSQILCAGQKQGRNEFVIRLQPSEAIYMKLTASYIQ